MLQGKIATLRIAKATDKWATYEVAFTDGTTAKVGHALDREPLKVGDSIECVMNDFGGWRSTKIYSGGGERATEHQPERPHREESSAEKKPYTPNKSSGNDRDGYWEKRFQYEVTEMYPKIEFQAFSTMVTSIYAAGLPYLEEKPSNTDELNAYFQLALDKARSVFNEINGKSS